jgi:signal transduction histidine kinase
VITVVVAALFQPLRDRARKLANRIIYGDRATPYELLSEFSNRMGGRYDFQTLIPDLARLLADGTGAERAEVWLRVEDVLLRVAAWPEDLDPITEALVGGGLPELESRDRVAPVRHADELLGALTITKPAGEQVSPVEERLLEDAASQAGLAFKNVQLNAELRARLDELRASRQRLVSAQDAERRRLERDIHDGVQQHLVALSMKLGRVQDLAETDPDAAKELLAELQADTGETLQALRDLARGIHPPILSDRGLTAALEAHARRCVLPVVVDSEGVGRYPTDVESAVYFCCLEAIQNASKHSGASHITVALGNGAGGISFSVSDDGTGFDRPGGMGAGLQNISDRVAALSGEVAVTSGPSGTVITGRIPTAPI